MYYLKPEPDGNVQIYAYEPEAPYVAVEELPKRPREKEGYYIQLTVDMDAQTAEYVYVELPPPEPIPPTPEPDPEPSYEELIEAINILTGGRDDELDDIISSNGA